MGTAGGEAHFSVQKLRGRLWRSGGQKDVELIIFLLLFIYYIVIVIFIAIAVNAYIYIFTLYTLYIHSIFGLLIYHC